MEKAVSPHNPPAELCRGGGMPRCAEFHTQKWRGVRLPLEGKLAQRQLRLMRSKLKIITMRWHDDVTFDLIRHAIRRDTFPSRGRLFLCPGGPSVNFYCSDLASWRAGHAAAPTAPRREVSYKRKKFPPMAGIDIWPLRCGARWHKIASQSNARPK